MVLVNDNQKAIKEIIVKTKDNNLKIRFVCTFFKKYPVLTLETDIINNASVPIRDIIYKRIIDWDVCTYTDDNWVSTERSAYAWKECVALSNKNIQLPISGYEGF